MSNRTIPTQVVWEPLPGSQVMALDSRCDHTLYYGTRGNGKTEVQLMRFRRRVGLGYGKFWRGVIFDQEYKNLDDLIARSKRLFPLFDDGAEFKSSNDQLKWVWPTGEELLFRVAAKVADYDKYHGHEYPFIGWNELTKYSDNRVYFKMMSCNRTSFDPKVDSPDPANPLPNIPCEVFSTTNPNGPGHNWVKREFISPAPVGTVYRKKLVVELNDNEKQEYTIKQIAIFGSWKENPKLPANYPATLLMAANGDKAIVAAWLNANWNIVAGGAFDDKWVPKIHVKPRFVIPESWHIDRVFDWGSSTPFHVGWWAEADGTEAILEDGTKFCPAPKSLILFHELYGTREIGTNVGLKLSARDVAVLIKKREIDLMERGWILQQPSPGPADNQISNVREVDTDTIERKMAEEGVRWLESDKAPGTLAIGMQLVRDRLEAAVRQEGPALYVMEHCRATLEIFPVLARDPDKPDQVANGGEDHPWDTMRYRVLKGGARAATKLPNFRVWR
jgi:hypothetical protein